MDSSHLHDIGQRGTGQALQVLRAQLEHAMRMARRCPDPVEAQQLYREDAAVAAARAQQKETDKASRISAAYPDGRPTKRDRRDLDKVKRSWE